MESDSRAYQRALDYLREQIAQGALKQGDRLPTERALAEELGLSRNSTREAFRMLENSGVIESRRGSGSYLVGDMNKALSQTLELMMLLKQTDIHEVIEFRRSLEKAICATLVVQDDRSWADEVASILEEKPSTLPEEIAQDTAFHYALINATKNNLWITLMGALADSYEKWVGQGVEASKQDAMEFGASHQQLFNALLARDRSTCERAIDEHYDRIAALL